MSEVLRAFVDAWRYLPTARVLLLVTLPLAAAMLLWGALAWTFWDAWTGWIEQALRLDAAGAWLDRYALDWVASGSAAVLLALLLLPATLFTALFVVSAIAMPVLVETVARRDFPALERKRGGSAWGSLFNAALGLATFAALWLVSLPLWLVPPLAVAIPVLLAAWLNQRLFRYDALAEHASAVERERLIARAKGRLYLLGVMLAALQFVPVVNLVAPIVAALAFVLLCLRELQSLRAESPARI